MLDYRTTTFLTLCEEMNYRKTAERLNMTQPGVTQHIQLLQKEYGCTLFSYNGKSLSLTRSGQLLRNHLLQVQYDENWMRQEMQKNQIPTMRIGATKSIGDYMIAPQLTALLSSGKYTVDLMVDNTENLLDNLIHGSLDFAMIEGDFDKTVFAFNKMWSEPFVGICSTEHPLAGRSVNIHDIFTYHLLLREPGSGTRAIFENGLKELGYGVSAFSKVNNISSFYVLREIIAQGDAISFGYRSVIMQDERLDSFQVEGLPAAHDLFYVYQKDTHAHTVLRKYLEITSG